MKKTTASGGRTTVVEWRQRAQVLREVAAASGTAGALRVRWPMRCHNSKPIMPATMLLKNSHSCQVEAANDASEGPGHRH